LHDKFSRARARISGRYAVVVALILALGIPSAAVGFGEGRAILGGKRNPSNDASKAFSAETEIIASNSTYGTRQSNKRNGDGGGAIYGCRSNPGNEPCIRANNLKGGRAFEFDTVGKEAGRIEVGDTTGAPLTTNATGVATGLNADKVDGKDATDFAASGDLLFATVDAAGALGANKRGATASSFTAPDTYTVTFDRDVSKCSFTASPVGAPGTTAPGVAAGSAANQVVVRVAGTPFHLQVIC